MKSLLVRDFVAWWTSQEEDFRWKARLVLVAGMPALAWNHRPSLNEGLNYKLEGCLLHAHTDYHTAMPRINQDGWNEKLVDALRKRAAQAQAEGKDSWQS